MHALIGAGAATMPTGDRAGAPAFGDEAARTVATLDLDVLIDFAGVRLASGPLLALHPARALWIVAPPPMPSRRLLVDRVFTPAGAPVPAEMIAALRERHASMATCRDRHCRRRIVGVLGRGGSRAPAQATSPPRAPATRACSMRNRDTRPRCI